MDKLCRILPVLAALGLSLAPARAASVNEEFTFTYSTAPGSSFTLDYLYYGTGSGRNSNLLSGLQSADFGKTFMGSGSISTTITVNSNRPYIEYAILTGTPSYTISVSPVPLPDALPLFGLALAALAVYGYKTRGSFFGVRSAAA